MSNLQIVKKVISPVKLLENSPYDKITSNELTIKLNKINCNCNGHIKKIEHKGLFIHFHLLEEISDKIRISPTTHMLFAMILEKFNSTKSKTIAIRFDEYMLKRGLKDRKFAREQIKYNLLLLRMFTIEYQSKKEFKGKTCSLKGEGVIRSYEIKRELYTITLENTFHEILKNTSKFIYLPKIAYKIDPNCNPYAWNLITKIMEHKAMNAKKSNLNCLSVKTLVEACPHLKLETKHKGQSIIKPIERDLNYFKELFSWSYKKRNNIQPVSNRNSTDFSQWRELDVIFEWKK